MESRLPSLPTCEYSRCTSSTTGQSSQGLGPGTWAPGQVLKSPASLETHVPSQKVEKQGTALREEGALGLCVCWEGPLAEHLRRGSLTQSCGRATHSAKGNMSLASSPYFTHVAGAEVSVL